ncbi:gamma-tubulin complex component 2 isoform X3 [Physcomitrium patens]|uniref:gamma-tubulin complex component 2 isoform X3 n=1 Tax=Physcomitrium patens TaxID=3218 RepID=UPI000D16244C|nr:gamma-tubulin complex component 2-like isoform X3 [Physcomitrium patens]|eukprot:XP_024392107.1 gamma-tubulin complex component 2-like isoform X3 [Physcomitrella patens]
MERLSDSDSGYYPDSHPLELDENSDVSKDTEERGVHDVQSQVVQAESSIKKRDLRNLPFVSVPETSKWNMERPHLTGRRLCQEKETNKAPHSKKDMSMRRMERVSHLDAYRPSVQELLIVEELLAAMVGIGGDYICVQKNQEHCYCFVFHVDPKLNHSLHELADRILPICENYMVVSQFAEERSHYDHGLTNHAFAAGLRAILQDYHAMVAQLEHQFRLSRLSLPGLWFFVQPMMGAMQCLSSVSQAAAMQSARGAVLLNLLHNQGIALAGDVAVRTLLQKLTHAASFPYFRILERWVYEGVIDDPFGEFLIEENKCLEKESLSQDYYATFWLKRYSLRKDIPEFLSSHAEIILTTGKYLNAIRECGQCLQGPSLEDLRVANFTSTRPYLERVNVAHRYASAELLNLIVNRFDLAGRLRSVKHYFFVDKGDFLVIFMDSAKDELAKRPAALSRERLQSLLELAIKTSVAASDPYHDDLTCIIENSTLLMQLEEFMHNGPATQSAQSETCNTGGVATGGLTGIDFFVLDYKWAGCVTHFMKVRWPTSLVLSRRALTKYQFIFRHLFHCKHVWRQLCASWQIHQIATRAYNITGTSLCRSYVVCQRMLHFIQSFEHYMTFEVLETNWDRLHSSLSGLNSVDEVMQQHESFLDSCLRQCMFFWPMIFEKVDHLQSLCLQYATATLRFLPMLFTKDTYTDESSCVVDPQQSMLDEDPSSERQCKGRLRKQYKLDNRRARQAADDKTFKNCIGRIDTAFNNELSLLVDVLICRSQQEPYLADLVQALKAMLPKVEARNNERGSTDPQREHNADSGDSDLDYPEPSEVDSPRLGSSLISYPREEVPEERPCYSQPRASISYHSEHDPKENANHSQHRASTSFRFEQDSEENTSQLQPRALMNFRCEQDLKENSSYSQPRGSMSFRSEQDPKENTSHWQPRALMSFRCEQDPKGKTIHCQPQPSISFCSEQDPKDNTVQYLPQASMSFPGERDPKENTIDCQPQASISFRCERDPIDKTIHCQPQPSMSFHSQQDPKENTSHWQPQAPVGFRGEHDPKENPIHCQLQTSMSFRNEQDPKEDTNHCQPQTSMSFRREQDPKERTSQWQPRALMRFHGEQDPNENTSHWQPRALMSFHGEQDLNENTGHWQPQASVSFRCKLDPIDKTIHCQPQPSMSFRGEHDPKENTIHCQPQESMSFRCEQDPIDKTIHCQPQASRSFRSEQVPKENTRHWQPRALMSFHCEQDPQDMTIDCQPQALMSYRSGRDPGETRYQTDCPAIMNFTHDNDLCHDHSEAASK